MSQYTNYLQLVGAQQALEMFKEDFDASLRREVCKMQTPEVALKEFGKDPDYLVRIAAASMQKPGVYRRKFGKDKDERVRRMIEIWSQDDAQVKRLRSAGF